jgi:hypothetical protein
VGRRHELQTNVLAANLAKWVEQVKPYSSAITLAVVGIAAVALLGSFFAGHRRASSEEAWEQYFQATQVDPSSRPHRHRGSRMGEAGCWRQGTRARNARPDAPQ